MSARIARPMIQMLSVSGVSWMMTSFWEIEISSPSDAVKVTV